MANTFVKIASVTVGSGGASTIDFTSIPSTYTDLCLKVSGRGTQSATYATYEIKFNGATTPYALKQLYGSGTSAVSDQNSIRIALDATGATATSNTFGNNEIYIPNYAGSTSKSVSLDGVTENNATEAYAELYAGLWDNTPAITSITLGMLTGSFVQYSTATLYGIKNS
jgi:hypothetical protein